MPFFAKREENARELNLSGTQMFLMFALGLCSGLPLVWLFVRYWIFAP
jgi:hypothetical protein